MTTSTSVCIENLVKILRNAATPLTVVKLEELYAQDYGDGVWKQPPTRKLNAFLETHTDAFCVNDQSITLNPAYEALECVKRLEIIINESGGKIAMSALTVQYTQKFGIPYWKKQAQNKKISLFLARYPVFRVAGLNVTLNPTYLAEICTSRLECLLRASVKGAALDIATLNAWYTADFGPWPFPTETLSDFLAKRPLNFRIVEGKVSLVVLVAECVENLRQIVAQSSDEKVEISRLGGLYRGKFMTTHWVDFGKSLTAFIQEHPNVFHLDHSFVSLVKTPVTPTATPTTGAGKTPEVPIPENNGDKEDKRRAIYTPHISTTKILSPTTESIATDDQQTPRAPIMPVVVTVAPIVSPIPASPAPSQLDVPVSEPAVLQPASPPMSINVRIKDLSKPIANPATLPFPDADNFPRWRTTIASETSTRDESNDGIINIPELQLRDDQWKASESTFAPNLSESLASSDSHSISGGFHAPDTRGSSSQGQPIDSEALYGRPSARLLRKRSDFRNRVRQLDPIDQVGILERLLEINRRQHSERVMELRQQLRDKDAIIDLQQARIDELEEMLTLEGNLQGLDTDGFEM